MTKEILTQEILKTLLDYSPDTGFFTWKERSLELFRSSQFQKIFNSRHARKEAGCFDSGRGYWLIRINKKLYQAHRLAWLYMAGEWPTDQIDHIDGNPLNNKWENLRTVSQQENSRNSKLSATSTSGVTGVSWDTRRGNWRAHITVDAKQKYLGAFDKKEDAIIARQDADIKYGFHSNHGRG